MADVKESKGREKAKENTFIKLGTRPEDYYPATPLKISRQTDNCQLCGQAIGYDFLLVHKSHVEKNLYIGSDCIVKFCETYLPNLLGTSIQKMQLEMEKEIEEAKAEVFQKDFPTFAEDVSKLYSSLNEMLRINNVYYDFKSGKNKLDIFETISDVQTDYRKKKYTTGPKTEKIYAAIKDVSGGSFEERIKEYVEDKKVKLTISEEISKNQLKPEIETFYDNYLKYAKFINWDKNPTLSSASLSRIEKENFLCNLESYLDKRSRVKKKLIKALPVVLEKMKETLLDHIKIIPVEPDSNEWGYYSDREKIGQYKFYVTCWKNGYHNPYYSLKSEIEDYGLSGIRDLIYAKGEDTLSLLGANLNGYFLNHKFLFKTEEEAKEFEKLIFDHNQKKIESVKNFIESNEFTSDDVH